MVEGPCINNCEAQALGTSSKARQRVVPQLTFGHACLVDADCRQHWQFARMAKVEQPFQVTRCTVHLMAGLRPVDLAGGRQFTVRRAHATDRGLFQVLKRPLKIELLCCLRSAGAFFEQLPIEWPCRPSGLAFVIGNPLIEL